MKPYPLLFEPMLKPRVWGGRRLRRLGRELPEGTPIGESWELADLPETIEGGRSTIVNGPLAGRTLHEAIELHRPAIVGAATLSPEGGFPLLIKYLDAAQNLSVQVHPDAAYVARHPGTHLKSEAWYVLDAEPGSVIYRGLRSGVTRERLAANARSGAIVDDLLEVPATPGDCHYLPSGTCHALGAGVLVAEVQTPSDTTFRLYDWGRPGRALHVDEALECIAFDEAAHAAGPAQTDQPREAVETIETGAIRTSRLAETEYFSLHRVDATEAAQFEIVTSGMPMVWMVIRGGGCIEGDLDAPLSIGSGTTTLLPAGLEGCTIALDRSTTLLEVTLPSPTKGLLA